MKLSILVLAVCAAATASTASGEVLTKCRPKQTVTDSPNNQVPSPSAGSMNAGSNTGGSMNNGGSTNSAGSPNTGGSMNAGGSTNTGGGSVSSGTPAFMDGDLVPHAFKLVNQCGFDIWPALQNNAGVATPIKMTDHLPDSKLSAGLSTDWIVLPFQWAGRWWGRTMCNFQPGGDYTFASDANAQCATGDCSGLLECGKVGGTGATTFAEMAIDAGGDGKTTFQDISLVDGLNLPMAIVPANCGHASNTDGSDQSVGCAVPLAELKCPLASKQYSTNGTYVACKSGCGTTKSDRTCCAGPNRCNWSCPSTRWSTNIKNQCKGAYSYAYDDNTSTYSCDSQASFYIVFCPKVTDFKNRDAEIPDAVPFTMWQTKPDPVPAADAICETAGNFEDDGWTGIF